MYLSRIMVNIGDNPDRPRPGRLWLRNVYRVHQRLCMAFPSRDRKMEDPAFLKPYQPQDFTQGQPHGETRSSENGFLFRVDPIAGASPVITVQSAGRPDWEYAFQNAQYLLGAAPEVRPYEPAFSAGARLHFRLKANPTKRISRHSRDAEGNPFDPKWIGKRVPVPAQATRAWIERRIGAARAELEELDRSESGYVYFSKNGQSGAGQRLHSVLFEGMLRVLEPESFAAAVRSGIGSGKAFGFGLLSLARAER